MEKDFNKFFWELLGVKHRVYDMEDIFLSNNDRKDRYEKQFERFLKEPFKLSNDEYYKLLTVEARVFCQLFPHEGNKYLSFCVNQVINAILNYKLFLWLKLDKQQFINMFAFQMALIVEHMHKNELDTFAQRGPSKYYGEHMHKNKLDTRAFDESLDKKSFYPFIKDISANALASSYYTEYLENIREYLSQKNKNAENEKNDNEIKKYDDAEQFSKLEKCYQERIGQWQKNKSLPSFIDIILISFCKTKDEKSDYYVIQMLLARAFLHIRKHKNIFKDDIENFFLEQLKKFREELKKLFKNNKKALIKEKQCQYLMPVDDIIDMVSNSCSPEDITGFFSEIGPIIELLSQSEFGKMISQKIQESCKIGNKTDIALMFNEKQYIQVIEVLDSQNALLYQPRIFLIQFIAALKLNDDKLARQYWKLLNRNLPVLRKFQKNDFKKIAQNTDDLEECIKKISKFLENVGN
ncbi:MAG: hypothetical protein LBP40_02565 [Campylobacteraceae bacterium]|jgi:hypothetical protein|nr:hypothetical protein [Campylobacteraceae bacterium]